MGGYLGNVFAVVLVGCWVVKLTCSVKVRGETCRNLEDCDTKICEYVSGRKICGCFHLPDYSLGEKLEQYYNQGTCQSKVNQMCTLPGAKSDGVAWDFKCVDNAKCRYAPNGIGSRENFGVCDCNTGYISSNDRTICVKQGHISALAEYNEQSITTVQNHNITDEHSIEDQTQLKSASEKTSSASNYDTISEQTFTTTSQTQPISETFTMTSQSTTTSKSISTKKADMSSTLSSSLRNVGDKHTNDYKTTALLGISYGRSCTFHEECITRFCHPTFMFCACNQLLDYALNRSMDMFYSLGKCLSRVHQACTMETFRSKNETENLKCVVGSTCSTKYNTKVDSMGHGVCVCRDGFVSNVRKIECIEKELQLSLGEFLEPVVRNVLFYVFILLV